MTIKSKIVKDLEERIASLEKTVVMQEIALKVLTEQRNDAYIEQANKIVMLKVNSLQPQEGTS